MDDIDNLEAGEDFGDEVPDASFNPYQYLNECDGEEPYPCHIPPLRLSAESDTEAMDALNAAGITVYRDGSIDGGIYPPGHSKYFLGISEKLSLDECFQIIENDPWDPKKSSRQTAIVEGPEHLEGQPHRENDAGKLERPAKGVFYAGEEWTASAVLKVSNVGAPSPPLTVPCSPKDGNGEQQNDSLNQSAPRQELEAVIEDVIMSEGPSPGTTEVGIDAVNNLGRAEAKGRSDNNAVPKIGPATLLGKSEPAEKDRTPVDESNQDVSPKRLESIVQVERPRMAEADMKNATYAEDASVPAEHNDGRHDKPNAAASPPAPKEAIFEAQATWGPSDVDKTDSDESSITVSLPYKEHKPPTRSVVANDSPELENKDTDVEGSTIMGDKGTQEQRPESAPRANASVEDMVVSHMQESNPVEVQIRDASCAADEIKEEQQPEDALKVHTYPKDHIIVRGYGTESRHSPREMDAASALTMLKGRTRSISEDLATCVKVDMNKALAKIGGLQIFPSKAEEEEMRGDGASQEMGESSRAFLAGLLEVVTALPLSTFSSQGGGAQPSITPESSSFHTAPGTREHSPMNGSSLEQPPEQEASMISPSPFTNHLPAFVASLQPAGSGIEQSKRLDGSNKSKEVDSGSELSDAPSQLSEQEMLIDASPEPSVPLHAPAVPPTIPARTSTPETRYEAPATRNSAKRKRPRAPKDTKKAAATYKPVESSDSESEPSTKRKKRKPARAAAGRKPAPKKAAAKTARGAAENRGCTAVKEDNEPAHEARESNEYGEIGHEDSSIAENAPNPIPALRKTVVTRAASKMTNAATKQGPIRRTTLTPAASKKRSQVDSTHAGEKIVELAPAGVAEERSMTKEPASTTPRPQPKRKGRLKASNVAKTQSGPTKASATPFTPEPPARNEYGFTNRRGKGKRASGGAAMQKPAVETEEDRVAAAEAAGRQDVGWEMGKLRLRSGK